MTFPGNVRNSRAWIERATVYELGARSQRLAARQATGPVGRRHCRAATPGARFKPGDDSEILPDDAMREPSARTCLDALRRCDFRIAGERGAAKLPRASARSTLTLPHEAARYRAAAVERALRNARDTSSSRGFAWAIRKMVSSRDFACFAPENESTESSSDSAEPAADRSLLARASQKAPCTPRPLPSSALSRRNACLK